MRTSNHKVSVMIHITSVRFVDFSLLFDFSECEERSAQFKELLENNIKLKQKYAAN